MEAYIPSIIRGRNLINAITEKYGKDIILHTEETDSEVIFRFKSYNIDKLAKFLNLKTNGANISPFSTKNLPKNKSYKIPDIDLRTYKNIVEKIGMNRVIELTHMTNSFLKSMITKKNTWRNIKEDMAVKGLTGKNYIHSIGKWDNYIKYLIKNIESMKGVIDTNKGCENIE